MAKSKVLLMRIASHLLRLLLVIIVTSLLTGCDLRYGFLESRFRLADESRLPKWFEASKHYSRRDLKVVITFYTHPIFESKVRVVLYELSHGERELDEKVGTRHWQSHLSSDLNKAGLSESPGYVTITVNGVEENFEHRSKGDILHITD